MAECCNRVGVFQELVSTQTVISLLNGNLSAPLYSANNRLLAYVFNGLKARFLIDENWQTNLAKMNVVYSSSGKKFIKSSDLSSALYNITAIQPKNRPSSFKDIDDTLDEIKRSNDKKRSCFL